MAKELEERRKYPRADIEIPVTYTHNNKEFKGMVKNIGAGGVLIHCSQPLRLNTVIPLRLKGGPIKNSIKAVGEVVWTNQYGQEDETTPRGMRIKFTEIKGEDSRVLKDLTSKLEVNG